MIGKDVYVEILGKLYPGTVVEEWSNNHYKIHLKEYKDMPFFSSNIVIDGKYIKCL